jgi:PAS domain S-box-containing protein
LKANDIIVILENEILIDVNPAWTEILGWTYEETIGKNWRDFILPEDVESSIEQIKQNLSSEHSKTKGITNRYITKNGKIVQLWWSRLARDEKNHIYTIARLIENFNP